MVDGKLIEFIEEEIPKLMRETKTPGLSIAVLREKEVIYAEGFGARNVELNLPATPNTLYGIG
ncbi:MAG TPA: serine hydrolase, partial [Candidatus Bathyarchaeota archaeon]|nr:serine hydrolase [Candidatus Bathyarchaeota archaeon]